jgi:branched-chain amino acid transport system permease protein
MTRILSGDLPRSRVLAGLLILIAIGLVAAPFVFPGARSLNVAAKVAVFVLLVASYDLLLGYTGIVSFAHTMFFGIGGYGIGIAAGKLGATWGSLALGFAASLVLTLAIALVIGLLSLRVRTIFFAMITLAVAAFFQILASQLSDFTGGEDGINFRLPALLQNRLACYYLVLVTAAALFLVLLRIVNSPFGRVLQSIRENEFRAEALGYRTVFYRTTANCLAALFATVAGALYALWLRYTGPDTTLSFAIMIDLLLMVVIGGMGTLYGAVIGATLFVVAQNYLQDLMKLASEATSGIPLLPNLLHPDRWLLWLGVLFVVCVYWFPTGIVGKLRQARSGESRPRPSRAA